MERVKEDCLPVPDRDIAFVAVVHCSVWLIARIMRSRILVILLVAIIAAQPALANAGVQIPEASSMTLFALGVLGVIVGRRLAERDRDSED